MLVLKIKRRTQKIGGKHFLFSDDAGYKNKGKDGDD